jgi:CRISPR/Cas system-associated exonuclease Cas4 (RecB family)
MTLEELAEEVRKVLEEIRRILTQQEAEKWSSPIS